MAVELSATAKLLLNKTHKGPNLILEFEGHDLIYTALETLRPWTFDDSPTLYFDTDEFYFDKGIPAPNAREIISLSGSGAKIQNQLLQDKGGSSSVSTFNLELVDESSLATNLITPGVVFNDILGRNCVIYLNFEGGLHPQDSFAVMRGVVTKAKSGPVSATLQISHPERKKKQKIFLPGSTKLTAQLLVGGTTATVSSTSSFTTPTDCLECYVQIGDEIIKYTGKTDTTLTGLTRAQFDTVAAQHEIDDSVNSIYRITGTTSDLALKLMHSNSGEYGLSDIKHFGGYSVTELDSTIIFFSYYDIQKKVGFVVGDSITVTGSSNGNDATYVIEDYGTSSDGSWVRVDSALTLEMTTTATCTFSSQYDVLPAGFGMGMTGQEVDTAEFERLAARFSASFPTFDFKLKEEIDGNFINEQILYPSNAYSIPRDAKSSIGVTAPPIGEESVFILDETNVSNPGALRPERGLNENFYNSVIYKYNLDVVEEKYLTGYVAYSADSQTRFEADGEKIGNQPMIVQADGLLDDNATNTIIAINARNQLERYQFAPEYINDVSVLSKEGYQIDIGDVVFFGSTDFQMVNLDTGTRKTALNYYEVVNKSLDVKTGYVSLSLLRTNFDAEGRYGTVSPSTLIGVGSTTSSLVVKASFGSADIYDEQDKWSTFVGYNIRVHSPDYSFDETVEFLGFSGSNDYVINVSPALSTPPSEDYIIDIEAYDDSLATNGDRYKLLYAHFNPQIAVVSGASQTVFDVGAGDVGKMKVGDVVYLHNYSYSDYSSEVFISDITGTTITVDAALGFTPSSSHYVELVGFIDGGKPYRIYVG